MSEPTLEKQISDVERKLEMRRERIARHAHEARTETESLMRTGVKWAPLILVGAVGAMAFRAARRSHAHGGQGIAPPPANGGNRAIHSATDPKPNGTLPLATLATVAGVVARAALTPQARELWRMYTSRHTH